MPSLIMALKDTTELFQSTLSPKATTKRTKNRYINVFFFLTIIIFFSWKEFNSLFVWFAGTLDWFRRSVWIGQSQNHTKSFPIKTRFGIKCVTKSSEKSEMIHHLAHHTYMQDWHNEIANPTYFVTCKLWRNIFKASVKNVLLLFYFFTLQHLTT